MSKKQFEVMTNAEYRTKEGISASDLKRMMKSMATWKYFFDNPEDSKDSPALKFGRAFHKYCLEPYEFNKEYIVSPKFDRRTKEGKEEAAAFEKVAEGREIIDEETMDKLTKMREALYATPYVKKLIYGEHEKSFFWTDEETGVECKFRADSFGKFGSQNVIIDLKTTKNADTDAFMRDAIKYGYDVQAAHYLEGMKAATGEDYRFIFICQETTEPYLVNILDSDNYFIQNGKEIRRELLNTYKKCIELDEWPGLMGFAEDKNFANTLSVPKWIQSAMESEEDVEDGGE